MTTNHPWLRAASCFLFVVVIHALTFAESTQPDVAPGKSSDTKTEAWTLQGDLGELPQRVNHDFPLSDQQNEGSWEPHAPLTDEFDGAELDASKWTPYHRTWRGRLPAWFSPENVAVQAGQLQLSMRKQEAPERMKRRGYHTYSSAAVHARELVCYGYFEVRAQPMNSAGSSSFWFAASSKDWRTEIDVFELSGKTPGFENRYNMNLHVFYSPKSKKHRSVGDHWIAPWRVADGMHVYGLDWNEREIVYYVDGVAVRRVENTDWHQPLYMIFDSETMPDWMGLPNDADLPSTYRVDYVRAWKQKSSVDDTSRAKADTAVQ